MKSDGAKLWPPSSRRTWSSTESILGHIQNYVLFHKMGNSKHIFLLIFYISFHPSIKHIHRHTEFFLKQKLLAIFMRMVLLERELLGYWCVVHEGLTWKIVYFNATPLPLLRGCAGHLSIHESDLSLYGRRLLRQQTKYITCNVDSRQSDGFSNIGHEWELKKEGKVKILEKVAHSWLLKLYLPEMWSPGLYINWNSGSFELPVLGTVYTLGLLKINCCLTYSVTTLNSSISTILHASKVTQHGVPKRASTQLPMHRFCPYPWVQYFAATRLNCPYILCLLD